MSDQPVTFSEAQAGQPGTSFTPEEVQPQGNQEQPKTVPLTDFEKIIEKIVEEKSEKSVLKALETFGKRQQSERDKLEKRIDSKLNSLKAYNVDITPEVKDRVTQEAIQDMQSENLPNSLPPTEAQPVSGDNSESDPEVIVTNNRARKLDSEYGTFIDDKDPEFQLLANPKDSFDWLKKYEVALQTKAARLNQSKTHQPFIGGNSIPTNIVQNTNDRDQLWSMVRKKG